MVFPKFSKKSLQPMVCKEKGLCCQVAHNLHDGEIRGIAMGNRLGSDLRTERFLFNPEKFMITTPTDYSNPALWTKQRKTPTNYPRLFCTPSIGCQVPALRLPACLSWALEVHGAGSQVSALQRIVRKNVDRLDIDSMILPALSLVCLMAVIGDLIVDMHPRTYESMNLFCCWGRLVVIFGHEALRHLYEWLPFGATTGR